MPNDFQLGYHASRYPGGVTLRESDSYPCPTGDAKNDVGGRLGSFTQDHPFQKLHRLQIMLKLTKNMYGFESRTDVRRTCDVPGTANV